MNNLRQTVGRYIYYQHAREFYIQVREAERRRRGMLACILSHTPLTEEQMLEVLSGKVISLADKRRVLQSKTTFEKVLTQYSNVFSPKPPPCVTDNETCTICLMGYEIVDQVRRLKCGHLFHRVCVDRWLPDYLTCPLCRRGVLGNHYAYPPGQISAEVAPISDEELLEDLQNENNIAGGNDRNELRQEEVVEHATQREIRVDVFRENFDYTSSSEYDSDEVAEEDEDVRNFLVGDDDESNSDIEPTRKRARYDDRDDGNDAVPGTSTTGEDVASSEFTETIDDHKEEEVEGADGNV